MLSAVPSRSPHRPREHDTPSVPASRRRANPRSRRSANLTSRRNANLTWRRNANLTSRRSANLTSRGTLLILNRIRALPGFGWARSVEFLSHRLRVASRACSPSLGDWWRPLTQSSSAAERHLRRDSRASRLGLQSSRVVLLSLTTASGAGWSRRDPPETRMPQD